MNSDQMKGGMKEAAGKVQRKTGEAINSPEQQAKGLAREVEGKAQKNYGDLKEDVKDAAKATRDTVERDERLRDERTDPNNISRKP